MTRLTEDEQTAVKYAAMPLTGMERLELLHFLGYPDPMPSGTEARVREVVEQILANRGFEPLG